VNTNSGVAMASAIMFLRVLMMVTAVDDASPPSCSCQQDAVMAAKIFHRMADRGQITGGILDGPLAFDNAIEPEAAKIKGIKSAVAGRAQMPHQFLVRDRGHPTDAVDSERLSGNHKIDADPL
jgi:phosphotransacetylase